MIASTAGSAVGGAGCAQLLGLGEVEVVDGSNCPVAPPGTVIACANITHVRADGTTYTSRRDLSHYTVAAYIPEASGFRIVSGTASSDGTARIEGVPDGAAYYFRIQNPLDTSYYWPHYFYTDKRTLELGHAQIGRDDTPTVADTEITVSMTGMKPWKDSDAASLVSFQSGTEVLLDTFDTIQPNATMFRITTDWRNGFGESTFSDFTDASARPAQLIDQGAARGDDLWVLHTGFRVTDSDARNPVRIGTIVDALNLSGVAMTNGSAATIGGMFQPVPAAPNPLSLTINLTQFRSAFRDQGRYADETVSCTLNATPGASRGLVMNSAALVRVFAQQLTANEPGMRLSIPYTNPFPSSWAHILYCSMGHTRLAKVPGSTRTSFGYSYITSYTTATNTVTLTPQLASVANLKIGGVDGLTGGTVAFDGKAPVTMAWDAVPGVTHYQIRVKDETTGLFVAVFDTTQSTISLPADTFTKGNFYVFRVFAIQTGGDYSGGKLFDFEAPLWSARISTGMYRFSSDCGNGVMDPGEQCDPGASGSTATCDADCSIAACGDGFLNTRANEQCDEVMDSPLCGASCRLPVCGDNQRNALAGEECEDGNTTSGDGCSAQCKLESCGNNMPNPGEQCDDGNRFNGDGCSAVCTNEG